MNDYKELFNNNEIKSIEETIKLIESKTTGRIEIYIGKKISGNPLNLTRKIFKKTGLKQLKDRNGVLLYIATKDKKLVIFADDGINNKVGNTFWESVKEAMIEKFKKGQFELGIIGGVNLIGEKLIENFPGEDKNMLGESNAKNSIIFED
jgi:uncharacterized membrane protein YgcG